MNLEDLAADKTADHAEDDPERGVEELH